MLDFNHTITFSEQLQGMVDAGMVAHRATQERREYLGASRLGVACERALQYEFDQIPRDQGKEPDGRLLRIFERGHILEDALAGWLRLGGFDLRTHDANGHQFGFSVAKGLLQGHIDGVFLGGPEDIAYPALWESKCVNTKSFKEIQRLGIAASRPVYAAQVAIYQAYLELHQNPAIFTVINADSMEIHAELVPFDVTLAQRMSDRAAKILAASRAVELLPRGFAESTHFECRMCAWQHRCWEVDL